MTYQKATAEIVMFENKDVIVTSGGDEPVECSRQVNYYGCKNKVHHTVG